MGLAAVAGVALAGTLWLTGCSTIGYYWQSATGHLRILQAARPVGDWVREPQTPEEIRAKLELSQRIRAFASSELALPDNPSYRRYADLRRQAAIYNVTAAPPLSLELREWCFPVTGCVTYRGYYDEAEARAEAKRLEQQGYETNVYPVTAYSTLGLMNWAGGDPLLNTFIHYPEGELARLIFHELAHQVLYVKNDTAFNESFATAVERLGGARWLETQASDQARREYAAWDSRRRIFRALSRETRKRLEAVYEAPDLDVHTKEEAKRRIMEQFRAEYEQMKLRSDLEPRYWRSYDRWVRDANNASFGAQAVYDELVPGFEALFRSVDGNWSRFYEAARQLSALSKERRHERLKELAGA